MGAMMQPEAFGGYCYGPVDLVGIQKGDNTMWLQLQDSAGRTAKAVYRGCVYWRLEQGWEGMHVPMVQPRYTAFAVLPAESCSCSHIVLSPF